MMRWPICYAHLMCEPDQHKRGTLLFTALIRYTVWLQQLAVNSEEWGLSAD